MVKQRTRTPRNYDGNQPVTHRLNDILPSVLEKVSEAFQDRPDLILAAWPEVIGSKLAPMTQAISFQEGILTVKVKNSTLYSLLSQNDKPRLIQNLRSKFPKVSIKTIQFRLG